MRDSRGQKLRSHWLQRLLPVIAMTTVIGCTVGPQEEASPLDSAPPSTGIPAGLSEAQEAFWGRLAAHCGNAYAGAVADATPYYRPGVEGRAAVIHFFDCEDGRIHVPFHLEDNRSRNWILTRDAGVLRLKHDHRNIDGTEETISQYGGDAHGSGLPTRQIFYADAFTAGLLPDRSDNFWFLDFVDDDTLEYGVHWPRLGHSVRFTFNLSQPVSAPPAPWGYEAP